MLRRKSLAVVVLILGVFFAMAPAQTASEPKAKASGHVPAPSEFLGFEVGADRKLADYKQICSYFKALVAASPRAQIEVLGKGLLLSKASSFETKRTYVLGAHHPRTIDVLGRLS